MKRVNAYKAVKHSYLQIYKTQEEDSKLGLPRIISCQTTPSYKLSFCHQTHVLKQVLTEEQSEPPSIFDVDGSMGMTFHAMIETISTVRNPANRPQRYWITNLVPFPLIPSHFYIFVALSSRASGMKSGRFH